MSRPVLPLAAALACMAVLAAGLPGPSSATSDHGHGAGSCTPTMDHLLGEMAGARTYVQFHTDDGVHHPNTGPGDLSSPGEIRGDVTVDPDDPDLFTATADKDQNVFGHGADQSPWAGVTATADLRFVAAAGDDGSRHVTFSLDVRGLANVSGIHLHNGAPGQSNPVHLADLLTGQSSLIDGIGSGPVASMDGTFTGTIRQADICPGSVHSQVAAPVIAAPAAGSKITPTPAISGTADPGVLVSVFDGAPSHSHSGSPPTLLGTSASDSAGAWSLQVTVPLAAGPHTITATATDVFANMTSGGSGPVTVTVVDVLGSISGVVFADLNGNGIRDAGESGIQTTVTATDYADPLSVARASSDGSGSYSLGGLIPGDYLVQLAIPAGHFLPAGADYFAYVSVSGSGGPAVQDFALKPLGRADASEVAGTVFDDLDGDGVRGAGEPGIPGVPVIAFDLLTATTSTAVTAGDGTYSMGGLVPGTTLVQTGLLPAGYLPTDGLPPFSYVDLRQSSAATVDFSLHGVTDADRAGLTGTLCEDDNANGLCDPREAGFDRVTVYVTGLSTLETRTATTDSRGTYSFAGLAPDLVLFQTGLIPADHLPQAGHSSYVYQKLAPGSDAVIDIPMRHVHPGDTATVSGTVYHDTNGNGIREPGEPGMPDISVLVTALSTGQQEETVTDGAGSFVIDEVMPDTVLIQQLALPAGFAPSTSNGGFEYRTLSDGQAALIMFGNNNNNGSGGG